MNVNHDGCSSGGRDFRFALGVHHVTVALGCLLWRFSFTKLKDSDFCQQRLLYAVSFMRCYGLHLFANRGIGEADSHWGRSNSLQSIWWHITEGNIKHLWYLHASFAVEELRSLEAICFVNSGPGAAAMR